MRLELNFDDRNFKFTLKELKNRESKSVSEFISLCFRNRLSFFHHLVQKYRTNYRIVKYAVKQYGYGIEFASKKLRANYILAKYAVKQNGNALECVSNELRANYNIVKYAAKNYGHAIIYASKDLNIDYDIKKYRLNDGDLIRCLSDNLVENYRLIKYALKHNRNAFYNVIDKMQYKMVNQIIKLAIAYNPCFFGLVEKQKNYKNCVLANFKKYKIILLNL